jgi:NAD(P) transhydrogenase subunit beta
MLIIDFIYLLAAVLFILGIKQLTRIKTARNGNLLAAVAMFLAVLATLLKMHFGDADLGIAPGQIGWVYIISGIIIGAAIGSFLSIKVKMTQMPQMVAIFNGFGGGASTLVALSYFWSKMSSSLVLDSFDITTVILSIIIGTITFTGSLIAFAKLQALIDSRPILFKGNNLLNLFLFLGILGLGGYIFLIRSNFSTTSITFLILIGVAAVLGVLLVTPIGGADMPVVIALLNSYSGIAAAATGFVLKNNLLIISGALVGASGLILTNIMCKAMNRSLSNVLFGGFGTVPKEGKQSSDYENIKECSSEEAALIFESADSVIFIPGYGLAVAQAQYALQELAQLLEEQGKKVSYAIHPVAGRMPGHMNVLLAEANVPYEKIFDIDKINPEFKNTDVVLILGANDVVNPAAANDKQSPIYGMPILKAHEAKTVIVVKRSLSPGFAGIKNELFENENTLMLFGDAKDVLINLNQEMEGL